MLHLQTEIRWRASFAIPGDEKTLTFVKTGSSAQSSLAMILMALTLMLVWPSPAQSQEAAQGSPHVSQRNPMSDLSMVGEQEKQQHKLSVLLNAQRQKSMMSDADKLLRLARELNAELSSGDSPMSTSQQARKVAEIEKLAHNVREKMSYAAGTTVGTDSPFNASNP
jgi:hypothetical protein